MGNDRFEEAVNRLGHALMQMKVSEGGRSLLVLVIENESGMGQVTVFKDGIIEERPMALGMMAAEAAEKARLYAAGIASKLRAARTA